MSPLPMQHFVFFYPLFTRFCPVLYPFHIHVPPRPFVPSAITSVVFNQAGHGSPVGLAGGVHATTAMRIDLKWNQRDGSYSP